jgi:hypothetical protein
MDRWTFLILAGDDGAPVQMRIFLRAGDDPSRWPVVQLRVDGTPVPVDDVAKDYEAPEWKALEIFRNHGGTDADWDAIKRSLRAAVPVA